MEQKKDTPTQQPLFTGQPPAQEPAAISSGSSALSKVMDGVTIKNEKELDQDIEYIVKQAEARVTIVKKLKTAALKMTTPSDWTEENGRPYLTVYGTEKIAPLFNVFIKLTPESIGGIFKEYVINGVPAYRYDYIAEEAGLKNPRGEVVFSVPGIIGSASTRDKQYKRNDKEK